MRTPAPPQPPRPAALVGWRLLALAYDALPVIALWLLVSGVFTLGYTLSGHAARENIAPFSALQWVLWACCWVVAGLYAVPSWRRGGQTLGMRPWQLHVAAAQGELATTRQLWIRYAVGTVSLLAAGLGFWWAWVDRDRLTWHDRLSHTRMVRRPTGG